ncbi:hypothetical protein BS47DRAFT_1369633 [Hydnum rufescens UP504]|uniref:Uncharacterized protein n=1 Tax=Hydnum rufescens UP504 TaxID=1448309 RepID=A0A9P6DM89_9AGAM|nr:hypothetical protein BS47DRAFT_1369633 [Hydnum rufescens UP504]
MTTHPQQRVWSFKHQMNPPKRDPIGQGPSGNMRNETEPNENTRGGHALPQWPREPHTRYGEMKTGEMSPPPKLTAHKAKATNDDTPNEDTRRRHNPYEPHTTMGDSPNEPPPCVEMTTPPPTKTQIRPAKEHPPDQPRNPRRTTPASAGVWQSQDPRPRRGERQPTRETETREEQKPRNGPPTQITTYAKPNARPQYNRVPHTHFGGIQTGVPEMTTHPNSNLPVQMARPTVRAMPPVPHTRLGGDTKGAVQAAPFACLRIFLLTRSAQNDDPPRQQPARPNDPLNGEGHAPGTTHPPKRTVPHPSGCGEFLNK